MSANESKESQARRKRQLLILLRHSASAGPRRIWSQRQNTLDYGVMPKLMGGFIAIIIFLALMGLFNEYFF